MNTSLSCTAEVCNRKAKVSEGADEGVGSLPTDFYKGF
jgi:hypothetical protein